MGESVVLQSLRAAGRFCGNRIGWNRIGLALSACIIALALAVLSRILAELDLHEVGEALRATHGKRVALAACFVAAAYFTLTLYDFFALRTLGRDNVPYRIAALAGFTGYSIGHNVGATTFSSGAIRYRIYSAYGLDAVDVAKVCFLAGVTFWLGNATLLGLGVAFVPHAATLIDRLPAPVNRMLAWMILALVAGYLAWVSHAPRVIGRRGWKLRLPNGPSTLLQIAIGIADLTCCALAMYVLLPGDPPIDFVTLAVIFVVATVLGFASHAPGGLGVFDAAMLVALGQFETEELLASLLLFRLLYYIAPLTLSLLILGAREVAIGVAGARESLPSKRIEAAAPLESEIDRTFR